MLTMYFYMERIASFIVTRESLGIWGRWNTPRPELPLSPKNFVPKVGLASPTSEQHVKAAG